MWAAGDLVEQATLCIFRIIRRSVETVYSTLMSSEAGDQALEPLTVSRDGVVTINKLEIRN